MAKDSASGPHTESGVQALIDRLYDQGVQAGQDQAAQTVAYAETRAAQIVAEAKREADAMREEAQRAAQAERAAAAEALKLAARDAFLGLKEEMAQRFGDQLRRLVRQEMERPDTLRALILAVAGQTGEEIAHAAGEAAPRLTVGVSTPALDLSDLETVPTEGAAAQAVRSQVMGTAAALLRDGVTLAAGPGDGAGLSIRLVDRDVEIDLRDAAVTALLLKHIQPRFRALLDGIHR